MPPADRHENLRKKSTSAKNCEAYRTFHRSSMSLAGQQHSCPVLPTVVRISLDNPGTVFGISPDNPVTCNTCIYYIGHAVVHIYVLELTKDPLECTSAQAGSFIVQAL